MLVLSFSATVFAADDHAGPVTAKPYQSGVTMTREVKQRVIATALGQHLFASVLSRIDSRTAPELAGDNYPDRSATTILAGWAASREGPEARDTVIS